MLDNEKYWEYLKKEKERRLEKNDMERLRVLERARFTGKATLNFGEIVINFFEGGVTNMNKKLESAIEVEESIKLK